MLKLITSISRLSLAPTLRNPSRDLTSSSALYFQVTEPKCSSLAKKKRKTDPGQIKAKEEKRRRRLAKALRKMEKKDRLPKPLLECEVPIVLHQERADRLRGIKISDEEAEARVLHMKDWSRYCYARNRNELWHLDKILINQQKALEELKNESVSLYEQAIQFDADLIPLSFKGPVATPPIKDYLQDGEYKETTPSFKVIYEDTDAFMKELLMRRRKKKKSDEEE